MFSPPRLSGIFSNKFVCSSCQKSRFVSQNLTQRLTPSHLVRTANQSRTASTAPNVSRTWKNAPLKSSTGSYMSTKQRLLNSTSPTLLYESKIARKYIVGCWLVGGSCIAWSFTNYYNIFYDPMGELAAALKRVMGFAIGGVFVFGVFISLRAHRVVRKLSAVSQVVSPSQKQLCLVIESYRTAPFVKARTVTVPVDKVSLVPSSYDYDPIPYRRMLAAQPRLKDGGNVLALPLKLVVYWIRRGYAGFKNIMIADHCAYLYVKDMQGSWKLDKDPDWALEDGRVLEELTNTI